MGIYVPFACLGSGGMADVFLSVARGTAGFNRLAVVKRLRNPEDDAKVEMFLDEARLAARLTHPNIVHTYEVGTANGKYFIAMEYLEGQALHALASRLHSRSEGLTEPLLAYVVSQGLKGLHSAHELRDFDGTLIGVVHRDISPHNLYLTYGGEVKLLDFGIAKAKMNSSHTETGVLKGKIRYMAPELIAGEDVDRRADIYAFGVLLWELLARRALYQGDAAAIMVRIVSEDVAPASSVRPEVSPALEAIALRALSRNPADRYATADEMRMALEEFLRDHKNARFDEELGRVVAAEFAATRDDVRQRIKTFLDKMQKAGELGSSPGTPRGDLPLLEASGTSSPHMRGPVDATLRPKQRRAVYMAVAAAVAFVSVLALLARPTAPGPIAVQAVPVAARWTARVRLDTTPPGALIERNGRPIDRTPAEFDLETGIQTLRLSLDGYEAATVELNVQSGTFIDRKVALRATAAPEAVSAPSATPPAMSRRVVPPPAIRPSVSAAQPPKPTAPPPRSKIRVLDDNDVP
jgi:serine/threonine protein kinase